MSKHDVQLRTLKVETLAQTHVLGQKLAQVLVAMGAQSLNFTPPAILLRGDLGAGKTTLSRALVEALPGGAEAEVASPSFTLCNSYPTQPPVIHADLYRLGENPAELLNNLPEELVESLEGDGSLLILEWAEYLPQQRLPQEYLDILFQPCDEKRLLTFSAKGLAAQSLLHSVF